MPISSLKLHQPGKAIQNINRSSEPRSRSSSTEQRGVAAIGKESEVMHSERNLEQQRSENQKGIWSMEKKSISESQSFQKTVLIICEAKWSSSNWK